MIPLSNRLRLPFQALRAANHHPDIAKIALRCLITTGAVPDNSCECPWPKGNLRSNSYMNTLPWFSPIDSNIHNNITSPCSRCGIQCDSNQNRAHQPLHYTLHVCPQPDCDTAILHTPAYRNHWVLAHASSYPLSLNDKDKTKRQLAIKIEDKFDLPLVLPTIASQLGEPWNHDNFHSAAFSNWRQANGRRTARDEHRISQLSGKDAVLGEHSDCSISICRTPGPSPPLRNPRP